MVSLLEAVIETAKAVESEDPIDWGMLEISEDSAYNLIASGMLEQHLATDPKDREVMLLAVATKLLVENFVLHLKQMKRNAD